MIGRRGSLRFLAVPPFAWLILFFVAPLLLAILISLREGRGPVGFGSLLDLSTVQYGKILGTPSWL